ncbi:MAG: hypothetical protein JW839_13240 [Candidatus Lokiarchaeota archaeon]|nr:hypothetical protein [Candidatus Lokiarchaeota archaeon]
MGYHGPLAYFSSYTLVGLIAFFFFLIPGVEFLEEILAGLITDLDSFILSIPDVGFFNIGNLLYLAETGAEVAVFNAYPLHWTLSYRPEDAWAIALQIIPWLGSGAIVGAIFPENPKDALIIGVGMILAASLNTLLAQIILPLILLNLPMFGMVGPLITGIMNGMATGFTDLPMGVSSILAIVEGGGLFIAMALFMSTLKSNEAPYPESEGGGKASLIMTSIFGSILCIPGFIIGVVNTSKNPGDRKAIMGTILGAMQLAIFVMVLFVFIPAPSP